MSMRQTLPQAFIQCTNGRAVELCQARGHRILPIEIEQTGIVRRFGILQLQEGEGFQGLSRSLEGLRIDNG